MWRPIPRELSASFGTTRRVRVNGLKRSSGYGKKVSVYSTTPSEALNGYQGCPKRSTFCLHRRLLGTACFVCNLAGVGGVWRLDDSKSIYPDHRHRGILHLSIDAIDAAFVVPPHVFTQREFAP